MVEVIAALALAGWLLVSGTASWYIYWRHRRETRAWLLLQTKVPAEEVSKKWDEFELEQKSEFEVRYHDYEPIGVHHE